MSEAEDPRLAAETTQTGGARTNDIAIGMLDSSYLDEIQLCPSRMQFQPTARFASARTTVIAPAGAGITDLACRDVFDEQPV